MIMDVKIYCDEAVNGILFVESLLGHQHILDEVYGERGKDQIEQFEMFVVSTSNLLEHLDKHSEVIGSFGEVVLEECEYVIEFSCGCLCGFTEISLSGVFGKTLFFFVSMRQELNTFRAEVQTGGSQQTQESVKYYN